MRTRRRNAVRPGDVNFRRHVGGTFGNTSVIPPRRRLHMVDKPSPIVMEEVTDPEELAKARAQRERFDRNSAWLQAHITEIYACYRGKCVVLAGEELFAA